MDPTIEICRRWMSYQARRVAASLFNDTYAPGERLVRRDRLMDAALAARPLPADERRAS